ncbi:hypothetical protein [Methanosarcina barkeri]|uniref:hypothetical protein n=1 Tax=Methanosarcina barkeri TaxID=2208 RepID=UPI00003C6831|nr:hypothetical protein [Methanosarcina barkeri]
MNVPVKIPVHKTRKARLKSHLQDYRITSINHDTQKELIRSLFQTPNLETFYPEGAVL